MVGAASFRERIGDLRQTNLEEVKSAGFWGPIWFPDKLIDETYLSRCRLAVTWINHGGLAKPAPGGSMTTKRLAPLRDEFWALELLARHTAVARWRGQPSCSAREVLQTLDASLFQSNLAIVVEPPKDALVELEPTV